MGYLSLIDLASIQDVDIFLFLFSLLVPQIPEGGGGEEGKRGQTPSPKPWPPLTRAMLRIYISNNVLSFLPIYNVNKPFTAQHIDALKSYVLSYVFQTIRMLRQGKRLNLILVQDREL